ncbi:hypothetical protein [Pedobacter sp. KBW06]|uniref:hypothetical protein n=1 Tax=Pedobacter sp. KBW06 TaxID=2153359 RepID=UPI000F5A91FB|nr:hypothetical protein [Pedobacter sp. KBW06]
MKKLLILLGMLCLFSRLSCMAQKRAEIPIGFEFYNHTIGLPFDNPNKKPFNLGLAITSSYPLLLSKHSKITLDGELGYFKHKELASGININTGVSYTFTTGIGIYVSAGIPLGYLRTFNAYDLYALNDLGEYELTKDKGRSSLFLGYSLQLGYDFRKKLNAPFSLYVKNEWWLQTNYSKYLPSLLQNTLRIGLNIYPFNQK